MELEQHKHGLILCHDIFTPEELDLAETVFDKYVAELSAPNYSTGDESQRKSNLAFLPYGPDTKFIFKRLTTLADTINQRFFNFTLTELSAEGILCLNYVQPGDHYEWHIDNDPNVHSSSNVKLIVVVQLSDPSQYEGADAQIALNGIITIPKKRGLIYAMPGWTSHCVTPLISGQRKILSLWMSGPSFK